MGRHAARGQTLAEFALVVPIFLLLVLGLFDLGRAVFIHNGLTNAAREAVRLAVVNQDETLVAQRAQDMAFGTTITTAPADLVRFFRSQPNSNDVTSNEPCDNSDAGHQMAVGCIAVVVTDTSWQPITPIIGNLVGQLDLQARSELKVELVCPNTRYADYATSDLCPKQP